MADVDREVLPLSFGARTWWRSFVVSLIVVAPAAVIVVMFVTAAISQEVFRGKTATAPVLFFGTIAVSIVTPWICRFLRHPHRVTVEVDAWGVTEREGDDARTSIPWSAGSLQTMETRLKNRAGADLGTVGARFAVGHAAGWAVFVAWDSNHRQLPRFRRVMTTKAFEPARIRHLAPSNVAGTDALPRDARDALRGHVVKSRLLGLLFLATLAAAAIVFQGDLTRTRSRQATPLFVVAAILACARCIRPRSENVALLARMPQRARVFELQGEPREGLALATDASGHTRALDLSSAPHPDALLATRKTRIHAEVVDESPSAAGAYRDDGVTRVIAVETERDARERARIVLANRIEIGARCCLAAGLALVALLVGLGKLG